MSSKVELVIKVDKAFALENVATRLSTAGLESHSVLHILGIVTGLADRDRIAAIRAVQGVVIVEEGRSVKTLGPGPS